MIKQITEGKRSVRRVVRNGKVAEYSVGDFSVAATLATNNHYKKRMDAQVELARRFIKLKTQSSEDAVREVLEQIAWKSLSGKAQRKCEERECEDSYLRNYISAMIVWKPVVVNPFAPYIASTIPSANMSKSQFRHYIDLVNAHAKFHHHSRVKSEGRTFVNCEDYINLHANYHQQFMNTLQELASSAGERLPEAQSADFSAAYQSAKKVMESHFPGEYDRWVKSNEPTAAS